MRKQKILTLIIATLLLFSIIFNFSACVAGVILAEDLTKGYTPAYVERSEHRSEESIAMSNLALRLLYATYEDDKSSIISPVSILLALAMVMNGAAGATLVEMEIALRMDLAELNDYLYSYCAYLPSSDKYNLSIANSVWFIDSPALEINEAFLQTNADYYRASLYKAPFNKSTVNDINTWVRRNTDGMIKDIVDDIPPEAIMYIVSALAFDAEWENIYKKNQVRNGDFTKENGDTVSAKFMYSTESSYIEDKNATGFIKYYKDRKYAFAALLPNEGISISDYMVSLNGYSLNEMLLNPTSATVITSMPKFESEYSEEISMILEKFGIYSAFNPYNADFSLLGSYSGGNIFINSVIHKSYISVNEKGTRAGAATLIEVKNTADNIDESKYVYLDRPFVYMIIDTETATPLFIGTMMEP